MKLQGSFSRTITLQVLVDGETIEKAFFFSPQNGIPLLLFFLFMAGTLRGTAFTCMGKVSLPDKVEGRVARLL